jgi:excisionase family DNA binding protein
MANRKKTSAHEPLTVSVLTAAGMLGISRSRIYELLATGEIETIKIGRRNLVLVESLKTFVEVRRYPRRKVE